MARDPFGEAFGWLALAEGNPNLSRQAKHSVARQMLDEIERQQQRDPRHIGIYHSLRGDAFIVAGKRRAALREYQLAFLANPNDAESGVRVAYLLAGRGQTLVAIELLSSIARLHPLNPSPLIGMSFVLAGSGAQEHALEYRQKAVALLVREATGECRGS